MVSMFHNSSALAARPRRTNCLRVADGREDRRRRRRREERELVGRVALPVVVQRARAERVVLQRPVEVAPPLRLDVRVEAPLEVLRRPAGSRVSRALLGAVPHAAPLADEDGGARRRRRVAEVRVPDVGPVVRVAVVAPVVRVTVDVGRQHELRRVGELDGARRVANKVLAPPAMGFRRRVLALATFVADAGDDDQPAGADVEHVVAEARRGARPVGEEVDLLALVHPRRVRRLVEQVGSDDVGLGAVPLGEHRPRAPQLQLVVLVGVAPIRRVKPVDAPPVLRAVLGMHQIVHVEHHEDARAPQRGDHAVEHVERARVTVRPAVVARLGVVDHPVRAERQPHRVEAVVLEELDVLVDGVALLVELVGTAVLLKTRPIRALDVQRRHGAMCCSSSSLHAHCGAIQRRPSVSEHVERDGEGLRAVGHPVNGDALRDGERRAEHGERPPSRRAHMRRGAPTRRARDSTREAEVRR